MDLLFNEEQFKAIMTDFYIITNIKIVFYDNNLNPIFSVPENDCEFCSELKKNPNALKKCENCIEKEVKKCRELNQLNIYKCHCGLTEAVAPIKIDDIILGYIMFGQIINNTDQQNKKDEIIQYVKQYCSSDMRDKFNKITIKSIEQIHSIAKFMELCIYYLAINNFIKSDHTSLAFKITSYINENLSTEISVSKLCNLFGISRNALYKIFNDYHGISVAKYIRKKRIEVAQKLIASGTSITTAASMVGFYDYNYFSKVFKNSVGLSPLKYKQKHTK